MNLGWGEFHGGGVDETESAVLSWTQQETLRYHQWPSSSEGGTMRWMAKISIYWQRPLVNLHVELSEAGWRLITETLMLLSN